MSGTLQSRHFKQQVVNMANQVRGTDAKGKRLPKMTVKEWNRQIQSHPFEMDKK